MGSGSRDDVRPNALFELDAQVTSTSVLPHYVPQMFRVEVEVWHIVVSAAPDDLAAKSTREAGFEVDALPLAREIGDDELRALYLGQHAVGDWHLTG